MSLRENAAVGLKPVGFNFHYDVSLPIKDMYDLVEMVGLLLKIWFQIQFSEHLDVQKIISFTYILSLQVTARLDGIQGAVCCGFGHIGDNDLHISPIVPEFSKAVS